MSLETLARPDDEAYGRLLAEVERRYGILIPPERDAAVRQSLDDSCSTLGLSDVATMVERLVVNDVHAVDHVIRAATVNHTGFLREPAAFEVILDEVIPTLEPHRDVRIWSAAASTGEEIYTLAMLAAERVGMDELDRRWHFLGTDIDSEAVGAAEAGVYTQERLDALPERVRRAYFRPATRGQYVIHDRIRALCTFRRLNLLARPLPFRHPFDVVLCRNVLYYFAEARQRAVLESLYRATANRGWLLVGASDAIEHLGTSWIRRSPIAYRRSML